MYVEHMTEKSEIKQKQLLKMMGISKGKIP